jgi:hypothetical protein
MPEKHITVSYAPDTYDERVAIYAVPANAEYAKVEGIQIANDASSTYHVDLFWVSYKDKTLIAADSIYGGYGQVIQEYFNYAGSSAPKALNTIVKNIFIPENAALSVLNMPLYLHAKDFIFIRPASVGSDDAFRPSVTVTEVFPDGVDYSGDVDLDVVNASILAHTY